MKLALEKMPGHIPFGGDHYFLHPVKLDDAEAEMYKIMGKQIIEVADDHGERLLKESGAALRHQVEIAFLYEKAAAYVPKPLGTT